jgi:glycosyltransferase 2 family protein
VSGSLHSRVLGRTGWLLAVVSLAFVVLVAKGRWAEISAVALSSLQWLLIVALAVAYGLTLFLLAGAWHCLLRSVGAGPTGAKRSIYAYTTSQLAKFVPGNVFHIVGRHMIHRADGSPHDRLALASAIEATLMAIAAVFVAGTAVIVGLLPDVWNALYMIVLSLGIAALAIRLFSAWKAGSSSIVWLLASFSAYLLFFASMGAIVIAIVTMLSLTPSVALAGYGVASWLVGFITPGAPAGVGTREAVMIFLADGTIGTGALVVSVALFRLITFLGDVVCFAFGYLLFRKA